MKVFGSTKVNKNFFVLSLNRMHNESVTIIFAQTVFNSLMSVLFLQVSPSCPVHTVQVLSAMQLLSKGQLTLNIFLSFLCFNRIEKVIC